MKRIFRRLLFSALVLAGAASAFGQMEILPPGEPVVLFGGRSAELDVMVRNTGAEQISRDLKIQIVQLTSAIAAPLGPAKPWKKVGLLGNQTALEHVTLEFPEVRSATRFAVRCIDDSNGAVGRLVVTVYPTNLLKRLETLAGDRPPAIYDPDDQLKPLLRSLEIEFTDLGQTGLESMTARLAIVAQLQSRQRSAQDLRERAVAWAKEGAHVLLSVAGRATSSSLTRTVTVVSAGRGRVAIIPPESLAALPTSVASQLVLLEAARLASLSNPLEPQP